MCGISGILNCEGHDKSLRSKVLKMSSRLRHRGPDWSGIYCGKTAILAHERLSTRSRANSLCLLPTANRCWL